MTMHTHSFPGANPRWALSDKTIKSMVDQANAKVDTDGLPVNYDFSSKEVGQVHGVMLTINGPTFILGLDPDLDPETLGLGPAFEVLTANSWSDGSNDTLLVWEATLHGVSVFLSANVP
jgi:hypothetical protein